MKKATVVYGALSTPVQKKALEELSRILLAYTDAYPTCVPCTEEIEKNDSLLIYIGTKENNPYVASHSTSALSRAEEYHLRVEQNAVFIEGYDDVGVLYGVVDFYAKYLAQSEYPQAKKYPKNPFAWDALPTFSLTSAPAVRERGLWTWGHVVYDYKGYFEHMMRLKMNKVVIWNDFAPVNAREIADCAHACGIKLIWGFSWLWDTSCHKVELKDLDEKSRSIFEKYEREYAHAGGDGIYFQTFTELKTEYIGDRLVAEAAADFVNKTAVLFYERYPSLVIEFGLHATSVKDRLSFIAAVDPRVSVVWEDAGAFPFSYHPSDIDGFDETLAFAERVARLRGKDDHFGAVLKGLVELDWSSFEHQRGAGYQGVSTPMTRQARFERKRRMWRFVQAYWLANADKAQEMIRAMCRVKNGELSLLALVEDGVFEDNIMYPVALFAEMLWDTEKDIKTLMTELALRGDIVFA